MKAVRAGNQESQTYWNTQRQVAHNNIQSYQSQAGFMNLQAEQLTRVTRLTNDADRAFMDFDRRLANMDASRLAASIGQVAKMSKTAQQSMEDMRKNNEKEYLQSLADAYHRLTEAQTAYKNSLRSGDKGQQSYWEKEVNSARNRLMYEIPQEAR